MSTRIAQKVALKSQHKHRMGAVIVKNGNVISTGYNRIRPSKVIGTPTLHAEAAAILKVINEHRQHTLVGSDLFVSRWTRGGRIGLARPCKNCADLIRSVGINSVSYTTDNGETKREKID